MAARAQVLVVEDDPGLRAVLVSRLTQHGHHVRAIGSPEIPDALQRQEADVVLTEISLEWGDGLDLCRQADVPVIIISSTATFDSAVAALRAGAFDYLCKPLDPELLEQTVQRALSRRCAERGLRRPLDSPHGRLGSIMGQSSPMIRLFDLVQTVAQSDVSVLVTGETGTGKELVATTIHQRSARADAPFVAVDCGAMPEHLLESELFGHMRGAFTDARSSHTGLMVHAQGGTLFLDEIGNMPHGLQPKLLRVLQERVVRPVGSAHGIEVDLRLIAATHCDLELEVRRGSFRHDLFFRVNVVQVEVPPLRERGEDILLLARAFVRQFAEESKKQVKGISPNVAQWLMGHAWPGNVRELRNYMERAVALTRHDHVTVDDLPPRLQSQRTSAPAGVDGNSARLPSMEQVERRYLVQVLKEVHGNKALAARILGFDRKTLYRKLERYGIDQCLAPGDQ